VPSFIEITPVCRDIESRETGVNDGQSDGLSENFMPSQPTVDSGGKV